MMQPFDWHESKAILMDVVSWIPSETASTTLVVRIFFLPDYLPQGRLKQKNVWYCPMIVLQLCIQVVQLYLFQPSVCH